MPLGMAVVVLAALLVPQPATARIGDILKFLRTAADAIELVDWGLEAATRLRLDERPPERDGNTDIAQELERIAREVGELEAYSFDQPIPTITAPPTDKDARRLHLGRLADQVLAAADTIDESSYLIEELEDAKAQLGLLADNLSTVADALLEAAKYVPHPTLQLHFVDPWFDIQASYIPQVRTHESTVGTLIARSKTARTAYIRDLTGAANALIPMLAEEQRIMQEEADALQARFDAFKRAAEQLEQDRERLARLQRAIEARKLDIEAGEELLSEQQSELSSLNARIANRQSRLENVKRDLRRRYNLCPNGHPYSTCTHNDEKRRWDNIQRERRRTRDRLEDEISQLSAQRSRLSNRINSQRAWLDRQRNILAIDEASEANQRESIAQEEVRLREELAALHNDAWRSRANTIRDASREDQIILQNVVDSLGAEQ